MAQGTVYPSTGTLLCDSPWIARSAAVMVPAPAQGAEQNDGVHLQNVVAKQQRWMLPARPSMPPWRRSP